ncbi:MAG: nuclear transport factor 2 family protein [Terracidiphilus sp.]
MKNATHRSLALVPVMLLASALSWTQSATKPDFEGLRNQWVQKLESRDLAGSLALYADDATFANPDGTHVSGAALANLYKTVFESFHAKIVVTPRSDAFSSSLAYEAGSYAEDLVAIANGKQIHVSGDYLTIYRRTAAGKWLIVEQMWTEAVPK